MGNAPSESRELMGHGVFGYCAGCQRALPAIKNSFEAPHFSRNDSDRRYEFIGTRHNETVVYMCDFGHSGYKCKPCFLSWTHMSGKLTNTTVYKLVKIQETYFGLATHMFSVQPKFADQVAAGETVEFTFAVKPEHAHPAFVVVYNVVQTTGSSAGSNVSESTTKDVVVGKLTLGGDVSVDSGSVTHGIMASAPNALPRNPEEVKKLSDGLYINDSHALVTTKSETQRSGHLKVLYTVSPKAK